MHYGEKLNSISHPVIMNFIDYFRLISYWKHGPASDSFHIGQGYGFPIFSSTAMLGATLMPGQTYE